MFTESTSIFVFDSYYESLKEDVLSLGERGRLFF